MPFRRLAHLVSRTAASALLVSTMMNVAKAEDQPFLTLNATDIEPALGQELEQNFAWTAGKSGQSFNSIEGETELEYGLTDHLQLAGSVAYDWTRTRDHAFGGSPAVSGTAFDAVRGEAIYQALNVYFDPIGLGLLVSPAIGRNSRSVETRLLLQKNFFNDRLRTVINLGGEFGAERENAAWGDVGALNMDVGIAYNITWEWSAAIEFNSQHNFDGLILNGCATPTLSTYYLGPTIQFVAQPWTASLGIQAQLPWASDATHAPNSLDDGFAADSERFRVMFRITRDSL